MDRRSTLESPQTVLIWQPAKIRVRQIRARFMSGSGVGSRVEVGSGDGSPTDFVGVPRLCTSALFAAAWQSTTADAATALKYAVGARGVLLRLRTQSSMERGADIRYLSAFPGEREYLRIPISSADLPAAAAECQGRQGQGEATHAARSGAGGDRCRAAPVTCTMRL